MVPVIFMLHRERAASGLISHHSDGEIISRSAKLLGYETIRGSTSKGGLSAFRKLIRLLRDGSDIVLSPDGPRGPRYRVQRGIVHLARLSGAPILPMAFSSSKKRIFNSWDAFLLPVPFSRGIFAWGEPVFVEDNSDEEYIEHKRDLLERELVSLTNLADNYFQKDENVSIV